MLYSLYHQSVVLSLLSKCHIFSILSKCHISYTLYIFSILSKCYILYILKLWLSKCYFQSALYTLKVLFSKCFIYSQSAIFKVLKCYFQSEALDPAKAQPSSSRRSTWEQFQKPKELLGFATGLPRRVAPSHRAYALGTWVQNL